MEATVIPGTIERDIVIEAPIEAIWRAVTQPGQISRWFTDSAQIDLRPNGTGTLVWDGRATKPRPTAGTADRLNRRISARPVVPGDEDLRAKPRELDGREAPHPARRPGEQHRLPLQAPVHRDVLRSDAGNRPVLLACRPSPFAE